MTRRKPPPKPLSDHDKKIWHAYAKGVKRVVAPQKRSDPPPFRGEARGVLSQHNLCLPDEPLPNPPRKGEGILSPLLQPLLTHVPHDRKTERALRSGDIEIDAMLDLHGMTQDKAFAALEKFMAMAVKRGHRNLLVITGKGRMGQSVLRSNLPQWLESLSCAARIRSVRFAAIKHGGDGAYYVLLKRKKT